MRQGIVITDFRRMMFNVYDVPAQVIKLAQCSPSCDPHLARRKVRIVANLFAKPEWIAHGILTEESLHHLIVVTNPTGDSTVLPAHQVHEIKSGDDPPHPFYSWKELEPVTLLLNGRTRFLYYPKTGEIWNGVEQVGSFEELKASKVDEAKFAQQMAECTVVVTEHRLDRKKYMRCSYSSFGERFLEQRTELWKIRAAKEEKARLRALANFDKKAKSMVLAHG